MISQNKTKEKKLIEISLRVCLWMRCLKIFEEIKI